MAKTKRTTAQRDTDMIRLAELIKEGKTQEDIAQEFGVSRQQISEDMAKLRPLWIDGARSILEGTAIDAALMVREVVKGRYSDTGLAGVRLRGAEAVLDRIGLGKTVKSENKHEFSDLSDSDLIAQATSILGGIATPGIDDADDGLETAT